MKKSKPQDQMLGEEKISMLLVKLSVPSIIGMITHALYNFVDTISIGQGVGIDAIGGLAIGPVCFWRMRVATLSAIFIPIKKAS